MDKSIHTEEYAAFLQVLRTAREKAGLTQEEVAFKLQESQSFVSKCERGERRLDIVELRLWSLAIGIQLKELLENFEELCAALENDRRRVLR